MGQCKYSYGTDQCLFSALDEEEVCAFHSSAGVRDIPMAQALKELDSNRRGKEPMILRDSRIDSPDESMLKSLSFRNLSWVQSSFFQVSLNSVMMHNQNFHFSYFSGISWRECALDQFHLEQCRCDGAEILDTSLVDGRLENLQMEAGSHMELHSSTLVRILVSNSRLSMVTLDQCRLENLDLLDTHFDLLRLDSCDLLNSNLCGISGRVLLSKCRILNSNFPPPSEFLNIDMEECQVIPFDSHS